MISVVRLWNSLMDSSLAGTAGSQAADTFNRDLQTVQTSAMGLLCPMYAKDTTVQELLFPFVVSTSVSTTKPSNCFYFLGATVNSIPSFPITPLQIPIIETSPIRKPSAKNPSAYHYFYNSLIGYVHTGSLAGTMQYIRKPADASIVLTPVSTSNRDYVVPSAGADLEWPENAFNLLLALMQIKMGIELKEDLLASIGVQGLQFETSKT